MRKLLYCFFFLLTFSSQSVAWAQDGRKQETAQKEQPSSTIVLTVSAENRVRVQNAEPRLPDGSLQYCRRETYHDTH